MSFLSGKEGTLLLGDTQVGEITHWRIERIRRHRDYVANDTGGAKKRVAGVKDCSGRFEIKATDTDPLPVEEGNTVTLNLHVDASGANYYEVPALIDAIRTDVDISQGEVTEHVVSFSANGPVNPHGILAPSGEPAS